MSWTLDDVEALDPDVYDILVEEIEKLPKGES
jgi:hypothetical protein